MEKAKERIEECGGLDIIEMLQTHDNGRIYETALCKLVHYFFIFLGIIENFFSGDDSDVEKENTGQLENAGGDAMQFNF